MKRHHHAIDYLKTAAILGVICHHSGPEMMRSESERYVRSMLVAFDVPVFLFVSGFLYYRSEPISLSEPMRRAGRILVPYLVASALVWLSGLRVPADLSDAVVRLLTGSALGIYYYVFLFLLCIPLCWPLSRTGRRLTLSLALCAHLYPLVAPLVPILDIETNLFWGLRNPLHYYWAYFLTGWSVAAYLPEIERLRARFGPALWLLGLTGIGLWMINGGHWLGIPLLANGRAVYSLSVVLVIALATGDRPPPRIVLFLSQATFTLYLYHLFLVAPLRTWLVAWPWPLSVPIIMLAGVAGPALLVLLGRRVLGDRVRIVLG